MKDECEEPTMVNGYFSVEAALLFPFVLGVILIVIYMLFYQYDRCLMEQSAATLTLRGCTLQSTETKMLVAELVLQCRNEDKPYIAWEMPEAHVQIKGNVVSVIREGSLKFPFRGLDFWEGGGLWKSKAYYEGHRIKPVDFIRNYRKLGGI